MSSLLLVLVAAAGDPRSAAQHLNRGRDFLEKGRFDEAVRAFDAALREVAQETDELKYSDQGVRVTLKYYPRFLSAQARLRQAEAAETLEQKRSLLSDAVERLEGSTHPDAPAVRRAAREQIARVEEALRRRDSPDDPFPALLAALRRKIDGLIESGRFEDALAEVGRQAEIFQGRAAERDMLERTVRRHQAAAVERHRTRLVLELEKLSAETPFERAGERLAGLQESRVPAWVRQEPGPPFPWLEEFLPLYEAAARLRHRSDVREDDPVLSCAERFDALALKALETDLSSGFRAAAAASFELRRALLECLASEEVGPAEALRRGMRVEAAAEEALRRHEESLRRKTKDPPDRPETAELRRFVETTLPSWRTSLKAHADALRMRATVEEALARAERALEDSETLGDPGRLRRLASELSAAASAAGFDRLAVSRRARVWMAAGIAIAHAEFLDGGAPERVAERCADAFASARSLDPKVIVARRDRLSPKIRALLEEDRR